MDAGKGFIEIDNLSQRGESFVFIIDFLVKNIFIFSLEELRDNSDILVHFQKFKNYSKYEDIDKKINFKCFPEKFISYKKGIDIVKNSINEGNSYLTNYTRKTRIETNISLREIFYKSNAKYKIYYKNKWVVFSPEIFVRIENEKISTFPMKGTIDGDIPNAKEILKNNQKETAEHFTVVDLLRNDISQIADDVELINFQKISTIKTHKKNIFAMSSEITGNIKPEFRGKIGSIMKKLLPAGSILGAPKEKTLEIILKSENYDRGFYTGVCGYFDGENLDSGVMIRFIEKDGNKLYFKSGGGITNLSDNEEEYKEMIEKIYVPIY